MGPVLVLAPHPDDEVFGCGGAIAWHLGRGDEVEVAVITDGAACHGLPPDKEQATALREEESKKAKAILGYQKLEFWRLSDGSLAYGEELVRLILQKLQASGARMLYAPSPGEVHPDHLALALAALEAARRHPSSLCLAQYEVGVALSPNWLLDITPYLEKKRLAISAFVSQIWAQDYERQILGLNQFRSYHLGSEVKVAEAFFLIGNDDLKKCPPELPGQPPSRPGKDSRGDFPLVSLIIRSIGRPTLEEALASIALQTYPFIEIVVVQALPDHPSLPTQAGGFPVVAAGGKRRLGRAAAANVGLSAASGALLGFLDDDDWLYPEHVSLLAAALRKEPLAALAYADVECLRAEDGERLYRFAEPFDPVRLLCENYLPIHASLFRSALVKEGASFDESLDVYEDWDFWVQILEKNPRFIHVPRTTAAYRMAEGSGFGFLAKEEETRKHLLRFFGKWQHLWQPEETLWLMERAKLKPVYDSLQAERGRLEKALLRAQEEKESLESSLRFRESEITEEKRQRRALEERLRALEARASRTLGRRLRRLTRLGGQWLLGAKITLQPQRRARLQELLIQAGSQARILADKLLASLSLRSRRLQMAWTNARFLMALSWHTLVHEGPFALWRRAKKRIFSSRKNPGEQAAAPLPALFDPRPKVLVMDAAMLTPDRDSGSKRMRAILDIFQEMGWAVSFLPESGDFLEPYSGMLETTGIEVVRSRPRDYLRAASGKFDAIILSRPQVAGKYMHHARAHHPCARIIFDTVDLHFLREGRRALVEKKKSLLAAARALKTQELMLARMASVTWVVSSEEKKILEQEVPEAQLEVVSNIEEGDLTQTPFSRRQGLLFLGNFYHPPNLDAVRHFLADIFPLLKARLPEITFTIAGANMPQELFSLAGADIRVTGYLPDEDLRREFENARVFVAPLRYGAGVKGKINLAMAWGLPVVASSMALEGMGVTSGKEALCADTPEEFAGHIATLYENEMLWQSLRENAAKLVSERFSRQAAREAICRSVLADTKAPAASSS